MIINLWWFTHVVLMLVIRVQILRYSNHHPEDVPVLVYWGMPASILNGTIAIIPLFLVARETGDYPLATAITLGMILAFAPRALGILDKRFKQL